jgi:hypothetical protein
MARESATPTDSATLFSSNSLALGPQAVSKMIKRTVARQSVCKLFIGLFLIKEKIIYHSYNKLIESLHKVKGIKPVPKYQHLIFTIFPPAVPI